MGNGSYDGRDKLYTYGVRRIRTGGRRLSWFSKNKKDEPVNVTYEDQVFDVGVTTVLIIFNDGREVHSKVYGNVDQYVSRSGIAYAPIVQSSETVYKQMLTSFDPNLPMKVYDDFLNPTVAWTGIVSHMEIHETSSYEVHFTVTKEVRQPNERT